MCFALPALAVAQLGTGGPYAYVEVALGPFVGFLAGALLFVTAVSAGAAVTTLLVGSVLQLFPGAPAAVPPAS